MTLSILLIEDSARKMSMITDLIKTRFSFIVDSCSSFQDARAKLLSGHSYALVILDMSIPTRRQTGEDTGGSVRQFGGIEILRFMQRSDVIYPVIVVTQYDKFTVFDTVKTLDQLSSEMANEFSGIFFGSVFFSLSSSSWSRELGRKIHVTLMKGKGQHA